MIVEPISLRPDAPLSKAEVGQLHRILDTLMQYVSEQIAAGSSVMGKSTGKRAARRR